MNVNGLMLMCVCVGAYRKCVCMCLRVLISACQLSTPLRRIFLQNLAWIRHITESSRESAWRKNPYMSTLKRNLTKKRSLRRKNVNIATPRAWQWKVPPSLPQPWYLKNKRLRTAKSLLFPKRHFFLTLKPTMVFLQLPRYFTPNIFLSLFSASIRMHLITSQNYQSYEDQSWSVNKDSAWC